MDGSVLVVHLLLEDPLLSLAHTAKDVRLALVATVNTHAQELLLGVGVLLVGLVETEDGVGRGSGDVCPSGEAACESS